ncbi:MAG: hypothetical protein Q7T55_07750 [Solirubrobacteraceae bacterium]|nr:hypothetical protein [Solirubrobacteraceae bacterium]
MDEIVPGILHWTTFNEGIGQTVHSHIHTPSGAIFDPLLPEGGGIVDPGADAEHNALQALADAVLPTVVLLSSRHHRRHSAAIAEEYAVPVKVSKPGRHEFDDDELEVETFAFGEDVVPGVTAMELPALAPDETVFHIDGSSPDVPAALLFGDSLTRQDGQLAYMPDGLLGDDPAAVKRGLTEGLQRILDHAEPFDVLLFAHGAPLERGGREALAEFVASRAADLAVR